MNTVVKTATIPYRNGQMTVDTHNENVKG